MCLTAEHYRIAEQNGISKRNAYQRWYYYGYDIQRAITEPIKTYSDVWKQWKETAKQNGVSNELYHVRLKKGMTPEQAVTTPVKKGGRTMENNFPMADVANLWAAYYESLEN